MQLLMLFGVAVHLIILSAVFKIYFKSPLEHGMKSHKSSSTPLSKRLVLFVADGLRAQSLYNDQFEDRAPFLHSKIKDNAAWGVAHTQVPTESRPGHVAMLAGFNEDPSAITKGWQANPVAYDSVINQSANAWCWGSPDIVKLFTHGNAPHIHISYYNPNLEDFSGKQLPSVLDKWVFDTFEAFIKQPNLEYRTNFFEDGNIVFMNLLGIDTAGHSFKPLSQEYIDNIEVVDNGIKLVTELMDNLFNDSKTTYIYTADHGMTNWGSHGDGSDHETNVPFIAWGAGIRPHPLRQDLKQGDIASLIASLLGINIPANSNGVVPLNYINATLDQKARILYANMEQLLELCLIKQKKAARNCIPYIFKPFPGLSEDEVFEKMTNNSLLISQSQYTKSINMSYSVIKECKAGTKYYDSYYQRIILKITVIGYLGWIALICISITRLGTLTYYRMCSKFRHLIIPFFVKNAWIICGILLFLIADTIYFMDLENEFYIYFMFPIVTWYAVIRKYKQATILCGTLLSFSLRKLGILGATYLLGIELLVYSFYKPGSLFFVFLLLAIHAHWYKDMNPKITWIWKVSLPIFGLAPYLIGIQSSFSRIFQTLASIGWLILQRGTIESIPIRANRRTVNYQLNLLTVAFINTIIVDYTISHGYGLWTLNKCISWLILVVSLILPLFTTPGLGIRCISIVIGFVTTYTLMSSGCESLFMYFFALEIYYWYHVENHNVAITVTNYDSTLMVIRKYTDENTVRQCFSLLAFIMLGFFGVGNMASLNSFNPTWVRCFVTVFSPFTMMLLILFKLIIPFLIVLVGFRSIARASYFQTYNCFLIILLFCNIMVLQFFFLVTNEGSWLEIGLSLSRFIVAVVTAVAIMLLYGLVGFYEKYTLYVALEIAPGLIN